MTFFFGSGHFPAQKSFSAGYKANTLKHRKTEANSPPNNYYSRNKKTRMRKSRVLPDTFMCLQQEKHLQEYYLIH